MAVKPLRLAVLLSGTGRTLVNLQERIVAGRLDAVIEVVISSRAGVFGIERANELGLRCEVVDRRSLSREAFQSGITDAIGSVDLVVMAGFLSLWQIPAQYTSSVINIHPALLPEFGGAGMYGHRVHEAVIQSGKNESGCTVHYCDNEYDHGPIILQRRVSVDQCETPDTLADKVFDQECIAYPQAIQLFAEKRISLVDGHVSII